MSLTKVSYSMITGACANVLDYGADSTGIADSTSAFNLAIATGKRVYVPNGTYSVNAIALANNTWIDGESRSGVILVGNTSNSAIFQMTSGTHIRIENMTWKAGTEITNTKGFNQTDLTAYVSWAEFINIYSWANLSITFSGFFIFSRWDRVQDGEAGSAPGGQYHQAIKSIPAATGQANTTNNNQVIKCNFNQSNDPNGTVYIQWGNLWTFRDCDFEILTTTAINAKGIYGMEIDGCWFENITATNVIAAGNSASPGVQGSPNVGISNCFYNGSGGNTYFLNLAGSATASVINLVATVISTGTTLTNAPTLLTAISGVTPRSGTGTSAFIPTVTISPQYNLSGLTVGSSGVTVQGGGLTVTGLTNIKSGAINGTTPASTGINVNQGPAGGNILLFFAFSNATGNASASSLYMIRCGLTGDNYTATKIVGDAGGAGAGRDVVSFSVVSSILYVAAAAAGDGVFSIIYLT